MLTQALSSLLVPSSVSIWTALNSTLRPAGPDTPSAFLKGTHHLPLCQRTCCFPRSCSGGTTLHQTQPFSGYLAALSLPPYRWPLSPLFRMWHKKRTRASYSLQLACPRDWLRLSAGRCCHVCLSVKGNKPTLKATQDFPLGVGGGFRKTLLPNILVADASLIFPKSRRWWLQW